ncbi:RNA polymerase sigma factor [Membranihabitans maritimus]|uniref:RNA polymerase sigma factor n=1 Tax=Membranihabitans maritimus TaxID=2904244 RepID=UPI001F327BE8|nr:sigma-70 family RNA polymerase sigma factor [Membranihabitans maritimus]
MKPIEEDNLIFTLRAMANGKEVAFRDFYSQHYNTFIRFGKLVTSDLQLIEDAIQNILIWFIENPNKVSRLDRPDVYLFRSLRNNLIKDLNKSNKADINNLNQVVEDLIQSQSAETQWMEKESEQIRNQQLQSEIANLPDYLQQTLYLRYFSNLSYNDIANILDIKPNVARIYVHRAIERLRSVLTKIGVIIVVASNFF